MEGWSLLSTSDRARRSGLKLHQGRLRLDIRESLHRKFFKVWNKMSRAVVEPPPLEVFERHVNMTFRDFV